MQDGQRKRQPTGESSSVAEPGSPGGELRSVLVTKSAMAWASAAPEPPPAHAQPSAASRPGRGTPSCASVMYTLDSHLRSVMKISYLAEVPLTMPSDSNFKRSYGRGRQAGQHDCQMAVDLF